MTQWHVSELSAEDNNLLGFGGAWWFAPGERESDIMSGGAVAFVKTATTGAEGGLSGRGEGSIFFIMVRIGSISALEESWRSLNCYILQRNVEVFISWDTW